MFEGRSLGYGELNARANRLAHYLRELGVGPEARVAICAERGLEMVVALLAVLKAGGAYVPLDPTYPLERLRFFVADSAPAALLTQTHLQAFCAGLGPGLPVVDLSSADAAWHKLPAQNPEARRGGLRSRHAAYVIYTSGSTGQPKGVLIEHRSTVNRLLWMQQAYALDGNDVVLQKTPFGFDVSVWEFFWPLLSGARLVMARPDGHKDPAYVLAAIQQNRVTTLHFVPSMLQAFVEHSEGASCPSLRHVVCSGEALAPLLARRTRAWLPKAAALHNLYGPTETTVDVTAWTYAQRERSSIPIGRPIANTQMYILDREGEPAPVRVAGELYIGGAGVGRGYLNRPELTAEKFVPDAFGAEGGGRLYRTGDLGRWLPDGNIEFLGRNDYQVKIRGFRIELGEIEARLAAHEQVREAVVMAREAGPGDQRLVAYYTVETADAGAESLRAHLAAKLPDYMVPAAYVRLEALPLTANGKLDRKALPAPEGDAYSTRGYEAPQGEVESRLAEIWAEVLKLERVGRHDNFFSLGGHSLLAVTLIERMRRSGFPVDVRTLFATPVIAELAAAGAAPRIDVPPNRIPSECQAITPDMLPLVELTGYEIERIVSTVPGGAANVQDIYPLAPLQEGILFHHLMGGEGDPYLLATQLAFDSRARLERYVDALQAVVDRHDILRTAVLWEGLREPVQVVWRRVALELHEIELDNAADAAEQLYARFNPRRFRIDVRRAPLLRLYIAKDEANDRWLMIMLLHHLCGDHSTLEMMHQ
ncbi:MAG TPA: amino acid adenylation domain-containing protein, partial [Terracidiphilus sp.]|nr:amino acid adenylation domain-containing protein [Terracidiphilus sp.]